MRSRNWSRTLTERSGGNGAVLVFMACYDCCFVQSMPRASKQQARYAVGRCVMLWSSNDVTQLGSRPKTKLGLLMTRRNFRRCLMEPIIEHRLAADLLSIAANSLLAGDFRRCASFLAQADMRELREFAYKVAGPISFEIHRQTRMPQFTPTTIRGVKRMPSKIIERQIYKRDGWHCRYCESRVISKEARNIFRRYFPVVARKGRTNEDNHFGLATLSATLDHLVPHKRGGSNEPENLVTACGPCQFGRGVWLLEEVQIEDPRNRSPILDGWDGLTRLLHKKLPNISSQPTAYGGG